MSLSSIIRKLPEELRTRMYFWLVHRWSLDPTLFKNVSLAYAPHIHLDLIETDIIHRLLSVTGFYELPLTKRVVELGNRGGTFVDIGANVGYFSFLWVAQRASNCAHAIEASQRNIDLLRHNINKNDLTDSIIVYPLAAAARECELQFSEGPLEQTGWGRVVVESEPRQDTVIVRGAPVDSILPKLECIEMMKIDVEGFELPALEGCRELLSSKRIKEIHFEQNIPLQTRMGFDPSEPMRFLRSMGYHCEILGREKNGCLDWMATPT